MKKNVQTILVAVVALAAGYFLGTKFGMEDINASQTKGDINAVNNYQQILTLPEDMAFTKAGAKDAEAIERTVGSLQIINARIAEYANLAKMMQTVAIADANLSTMGKELIELAAGDAATQAAEALEAAKKLQAGEQVNLKDAGKKATAAYNALEAEMTAGKQFVEAADAFLKDKNVMDNTLVATLRDMVASHCAVNSSLTQNDAEMDYWMNLNELLTSDQMATLK